MKFINTILAVGSVIFTSTLFANQPAVPCPTVDLITAVYAQVNDALPNGPTSYIVSSDPVVQFANRLWAVKTIVPARSQEDAVKLAQVVVKETMAQITAKAINIPILKQYGCEYFSPRAYVYAITNQ